MLRNYLLVAVRAFRTHLGTGLLNVFGLALGFTCFALIAVFVSDELGFDRHYDSADRMYRIHIDLPSGQGDSRLAQTPPVWGPLLVDAFPSIRQMTRIKPPRQNWMVGTGDRNFPETRWVFADPEVVDVFDIAITSGEGGEALTAPGRVLISESMAEKYFGGGNAVGQRLIVDNQYDFTVTGVMADMTPSAHFRADFLASFASLADPTRFYLQNVPLTEFPFAYTYIEVEPGTDIGKLTEEVQAFVLDRLPPQVVRSGITVTIDLMPVPDIHFHSHRPDEIQANGQMTSIWIFISIGLFVLLLACINFMNLATARSSRRSKEIGMRKVMGAGRPQLVRQFLGEAVLMSLIGLVLALGLGALFMGSFSSLTGKAYSAIDLFQPDLMFLFLMAAILAGLFAGSWPAFFLSSFRPAQVLKGNPGQGGRAGRGGWLRNGLVVFQFAISIGLIVATLTVVRQMDFLSDMPVGFDRHQVATIELTDPTPASRMPALREAFLRIPGVEGVSSSAASPAGFFNDIRIRPVDAPPGESWPAYLYGIHHDYVETMGMKIVAGRSFSRDHPADTLDGLLVNESAVKALGLGSPEEALGSELEFPGGTQRVRVIGVVGDFVTGTAREQPGPVVMTFASFGFYGVVRLDATRASSIVPELEAAWSSIVPGYAFDLRFLDERFNALYTSETVLRKALLWFSVLTVLIAALGLFGLAAHAAERRTREVGIRKVVGATSGSIVYLLTTDLTRLVVPAFLIAAPVTWWAMRQWLGGFAFAVGQSGWTYVATLVMALVIAAATVSIQSWRAASLDPVRTLRSD